MLYTKKLYLQIILFTYDFMFRDVLLEVLVIPYNYLRMLACRRIDFQIRVNLE